MSREDFVRPLSDEPVTVLGKLPAPDFGAGRGGGPASAAEEAWCGLFAQVLRLDRAGPEDSFLDLGGDSITSLLLVARARQAGLAVSVREVFQFLTPAALAAAAGSAVVGAREADGEEAGRSW
jgi:mycobactin peptide synthetase MbtF